MKRRIVIVERAGSSRRADVNNLRLAASGLEGFSAAALEAFLIKPMGPFALFPGLSKF
jgi:hypothetical protein